MSERRIVEYEIAVGMNTINISREIKEFIHYGYQPYGSLIIKDHEGIEWFHQAMVKYEES